MPLDVSFPHSPFNCTINFQSLDTLIFQNVRVWYYIWTCHHFSFQALVPCFIQALSIKVSSDLALFFLFNVHCYNISLKPKANITISKNPKIHFLSMAKGRVLKYCVFITSIRFWLLYSWNVCIVFEVYNGFQMESANTQKSNQCSISKFSITKNCHIIWSPL